MTDFDVEMEAMFDITDDDFSLDIIEEDEDTLIIKPPKSRPVNVLGMGYARDLAKSLEITERLNYMIIVSGKFVMGDFYAALLLEHNLIAEEMQVMTLSYSEYNIRTLARLMEIGKVEKLDLITSEYFFSHHRNGLIKQTYETFLENENFQLAVTRSHCKTTLIKTKCGKHIVIHGSSNLRSCKNTEQLHIQNCVESYNFFKQYNDKIISKYKTIRRKKDENN
jgi:hypothetical protein